MEPHGRFIMISWMQYVRPSIRQKMAPPFHQKQAYHVAVLSFSQFLCCCLLRVGFCVYVFCVVGFRAYWILLYSICPGQVRCQVRVPICYRFAVQLRLMCGGDTRRLSSLSVFLCGRSLMMWKQRASAASVCVGSVGTAAAPCCQGLQC